MVLRIICFCSCLLLLVSCSSSGDNVKPGPTDSPEVVGENLFIMHCAVCHGDDGKLGASGAKDLSNSTLNDAAILKILKEGKNAMPPMNDLLVNNENIQLVLAHIKKLRH
jgi:mono/diheme cytochrome c family protein